MIFCLLGNRGIYFGEWGMCWGMGYVLGKRGMWMVKWEDRWKVRVCRLDRLRVSLFVGEVWVCCVSDLRLGGGVCFFGDEEGSVLVLIRYMVIV